MADMYSYSGPPIEEDLEGLFGSGAGESAPAAPATGSPAPADFGVGAPAPLTGAPATPVTGAPASPATGAPTVSGGAGAPPASSGGPTSPSGSAGSSDIPDRPDSEKPQHSKLAYAIIAFMVVVVLAVVVFCAVQVGRALGSKEDSTKQPADAAVSSQVDNNANQANQTNDADQSAQNQAAPSDSFAGDGNDQAADSSDSDSASNEDDDANRELTILERAALLDPWYDGIAEIHMETKTVAELGVDAVTPLGEFCAGRCAVLDDGMVIARGTSETGQAIPTVISDYVAPEEWRGNVLVLDKKSPELVMVVKPEVFKSDETAKKGEVWMWDSEAEAYDYYCMGDFVVS